jgi:hypothetical protein
MIELATMQFIMITLALGLFVHVRTSWFAHLDGLRLGDLLSIMGCVYFGNLAAESLTWLLIFRGGV